jgi:hypothetical protein
MAMASALQQQLSDVRHAVRTTQSVVSKGKVSLLFSAREAADVDLLSIYDMAFKGGACRPLDKVQCMLSFADRLSQHSRTKRFWASQTCDR